MVIELRLSNFTSVDNVIFVVTTPSAICYLYSSKSVIIMFNSFIVKGSLNKTVLLYIKNITNKSLQTLVMQEILLFLVI